MLTSTSSRITGKERDTETGLDYFGARYYGSVTGRFSSPDPLLVSATLADPQTWNRYAYVLNKPLKLVDPTGLVAAEQFSSMGDGTAWPNQPVEDAGNEVGDSASTTFWWAPPVDEQGQANTSSPAQDPQTP